MDDQEFIRRFEDGSFPFEEWDHRAHLKASYLYLTRYPFEEAMCRIREGLRRLIEANQIPETLSSGYHETITRAWMQLVHSAIQKDGVVADADAFLARHAQLCDKHVLRLFYSPPRIFSARAKESFVEPDLLPLPRSEAVRLDPAGIPGDGAWPLLRADPSGHMPL